MNRPLPDSRRPGTLRKRWLGLSIRSKLTAAFTALIFITSLFILIILSTAFRYTVLYEKDIERSVAAYDLQVSIDEINRIFEEAMMTASPVQIDTFHAKVPAVWRAWNRAMRLANTGWDTHFQIAAVNYGFNAYVDTADRCIETLGVDSPAFVESLLKTRRIYGYLRSYTQELLRIRLSEASELISRQVARVRSIRTASILTLLAVCAGLFAFALKFSRALSKPIVLLANRAVRIAHGDLSTDDIVVENTDEVGVLTTAFNSMNRNIREMVMSLKEKAEIEKQLYEDERKIIEMNRSLREAQFLNLQSQISPHFFFNTLNTISRMSMFEKAPETLRLIQSLSALFRYTLNDRSEMLSLEHELNLLHEYLHIQKIRYGERLRVTIENTAAVDPAAVKIPVFTIQPIVENSIKYAVEPSENGGCICVRIGESTGNLLEISISDDGPGISPEVLERIASDRYPDGDSGIGLINVRRRVEISYGGKSHFGIECPVSGGTIVTIQVPIDDGH